MDALRWALNARLVYLFCGLLLLPTAVIAESKTWYFTRHYEKQVNDDPSLTDQGQKRAEQLARFFTDKSLTKVYSTNYNRTQETADPVAKSKYLKILSYNPSQLSEFAAQLKSQNAVLVVGHSNTTPELLALMGGEIVNIKETDYGVLYVLKSKDNKQITEKVSIKVN